MFDSAEQIRLPPIALARVNRPRLARYLELPSAAQIDPVTDAEIVRLDEGRDELLSPSWRAVVVPIERIDRRCIGLGAGLGRIEATHAFAQALLESDCDAMVVAAVTLGERVDQIIRTHLDRQEVYEAFVLKQWSATMTEQARAELTRRLRNWAAERARALLPFDGPGYNGWPLTALGPLLELLHRDVDARAARLIRVTDSGVLLPTNSMLIVHGLSSRRRGALGRADDRLAQCHRCAMQRCQYRVAPFAGAAPAPVQP